MCSARPTFVWHELADPVKRPANEFSIQLVQFKPAK